mmetsp:Transcript_18823/g.47520  ORF Transcript_18823/g.47520 Transcript_18823/m.47520 type:complete len:250 (+) Transcript_18823:362-1111(+)
MGAALAGADGVARGGLPLGGSMWYFSSRASTPPTDSGMRRSALRHSSLVSALFSPFRMPTVAFRHSRLRNIPSSIQVCTRPSSGPPPRPPLPPRSPPSRRCPHGGLDTTSVGSHGSSRSSTAASLSFTMSATPAPSTPFFASHSAPSWTSEPRMRPPHSRRAACADATALSHAAASKSCQLWKGQLVRVNPGARLVAMRAASTRKVPEPHMGSTSTGRSTASQSSSQPSHSSTPAAVDSFSAALCIASR